MDRYINAEKAINSVDTSVINSQYAISIIKSAPTEDVAPVVHAHWEYRYDTGIYQTEFLCSRCKELIEIYSCTVDEVEYEYCPHCGAKMDKEVEDA